jgi:ABC-type nickel/cobalt efflux system permease component RcnA
VHSTVTLLRMFHAPIKTSFSLAATLVLSTVLIAIGVATTYALLNNKLSYTIGIPALAIVLGVGAILLLVAGRLAYRLYLERRKTSHHGSINGRDAHQDSDYGGERQWLRMRSASSGESRSNADGNEHIAQSNIREDAEGQNRTGNESQHENTIFRDSLRGRSPTPAYRVLCPPDRVALELV